MQLLGQVHDTNNTSANVKLKYKTHKNNSTIGVTEKAGSIENGSVRTSDFRPLNDDETNFFK